MTARRCEKIVNDLLGLSGQFAWLVKGKKRICIPADEVKGRRHSRSLSRRYGAC